MNGTQIQKLRRSAARTAALLAACSFSSLAAAQTQDGPATEAEAPEAVSGPDGTGIIVTGSRIPRDGFEQPTPVTTLSSEELSQQAPTSIPDALKELPQFTGSSGSVASLNVGGYTGTGARGSGTFLNLYNLGANRMLVLQDGRRVQPSVASGAVDVNLLPQMLIQRVDIVTGGASATYGSDAIAGVVNFIIDDGFTGVKGLAQSGISSRGDNQHYRVGLAVGTALLDDRLNIVASGDLYHNDGIPAFTKRSLIQPGPTGGYVAIGGKFGRLGPNGEAAGTAGNPYVVYNDAHINGGTLNGVFNAGPLLNQQIINNQLVPRPAGTVISGLACNACADNYTIDYRYTALIQERDNRQLFGKIGLDLADNLKLWSAASFGKSSGSGNRSSSFFAGGQVIFNDNAFLPPAARAALANTPSSAFYNSFQNAIPVSNTVLTARNRSFSAGLAGKLAGWKWDVTGWSDVASTRLLSNGDVFLPRFYAAIDSVVNPATGTPVCRVTLTNPGLYPGCIPLNPFGPQTTTPEIVSYLQGTSSYLDRQTVKGASANVAGSLFVLPAGPVSLGVGGEYRKIDYSLTSNSGVSPTQYTGLRGTTAPGPFQYVNIAPSTGEQEVAEAYAELSVPITAAGSAIGALEVTGAGRYTHYETSGGIWSWKAGATWSPFDGLRLRGTRSRDIRAPSVGELFAGTRTVPGGVIVDPHTGSTGVNIFSISGGNPDLRPEKSDALVVGAVFSPGFVPRFQMSVDYFDFKIRDAVGGLPFGAQQIVDRCETSGGTDPILCPLVIRPNPYSDKSAANNVFAVRNVSVNVADFNVSGLNFETKYGFEGLGGEFALRALATYLLGYTQRTAPGQPVSDFLGTNDGFGGIPKLRATADVVFTKGPLTLRVQERLVGKLQKSRRDVWEDNRIAAQAYTDLGISFDVDEGEHTFQLFGDVQNLFDHRPPLVPTTCPSCGEYPTLVSLYDVVGRYFTLGVRMKW